MSHQVLARKWRPRDFASLVGQEHVVRALSHALDSGRLHHAYLFTGTRGVGKTTVSRILARALNCETGVTATPCGQCGACLAIEQGRFPDYVEMDAASNRGVDEMAQLLEQVVYSPVSGRYKVYMIDEVHMLSGHAFNAMLKTLEEPPAHVIFILATTDPRKVPVTVLSRCLQFNLKNLPPPAIARHLATVLQAEGVPFEPPALAQIGRAAAGSMRDALSLLDQAIAHGGGQVLEAGVRDMLGVVDRRDLERVLDALEAGDGRALVGIADDMLIGNAPFERTLLDFAALLQRIALAQVGVVSDEDDGDLPPRWAPRVSPEDLQAWYQIAIHGVRDLPLAPDPHAGFTMTLLRLLAFRAGAAGLRPTAVPAAVQSAGVQGVSSAVGAGQAGESRDPIAAARAAALAATRPASPRPSASRPSAPPNAAPALAAQPSAPEPSAPQRAPAPPAATPAESEPRVLSPASPPTADAAEAQNTAAPPDFDGNWPALAAAVNARLGRAGLVGQFMTQSELISLQGNVFSLRVPVRPLAEPALVGKVRDMLTTHFGCPVTLKVDVGAVRGPTVAAVISREQAEAQAEAQSTIESDPFVKTLLTGFDGTILPDSIQPLAPPNGERTP
jgi:DNA polymerase-3 subunit gamma/tau